MKEKNLDKRVIRTKRQLEEALFTLLKTKDINKISVKELTALIDINRSTFYDHYTDIYDLLESVQERVLDDIYNIYKPVTISRFKEKDFNQLYIILDYIKANKEIFNVLLNGHGNILFLEKLRRIITEKFLSDFIGKVPNINKEYFNLLSSFFTSGCLGVIQNWVKNNAEMPTDKLTEVMKGLIISCINSI